MPMSREQFEEYIHKLEAYSERNPSGYRLRVGLLAVLGYAYILFILLVVAALIVAVAIFAFTGHHANIGVVKIEIALFVVACIILRSLWVRLEPPEGIRVTREQAPGMFRMIETISKKLAAPTPDVVLLTDEFNAAAQQSPRLGVLGWQRNYLLLGLPFLFGVSPDELRSVVAHEMGHLSGNHSRFSGWIYRVELTWARLVLTFEETGGWANAIFSSFFKWYEPHFSAYSFVLRRANEFVADRCAVEAAGPDALKSGLVSTVVKGRYLSEKFWPAIYEKANNEPEPRDTPYKSMIPVLREGAPSDDAEKWLAQELREKTRYTDTHPSLSTRVEFAYSISGSRLAAGPAATPLGPLETTAAAFYLGPLADQLADRFDHDWRAAIAPIWAQRHAYAQESKQKLADLEQKSASGTLTEEEEWDRANWTEEFKGAAEAVPLYREIVQKQPDRAEANYALGKMLLELEDESGIPYIERAMSLEPTAVQPGCELVYGFLKHHERDEEADKYYRRYLDQDDLLTLAAEERRRITDKDALEPHGLAADDLEKIRAQIEAQLEVEKAYLARKTVRHLPEKPFYLLGVEQSYKWHQFRSEGAGAKLVTKLAEVMEFPSDTWIIALDQNKSLGKRLRKIPYSLIYSRPK